MYDFYGTELFDEHEEKEPILPMDLAKDRYKEMMNAPHKDDEVLIEDEFGRLRWVKRGSDDHMSYIGSSYRIRQQLEGKEEEKNPEKKIQMSRKRCFFSQEHRRSQSEDDVGGPADSKREGLLHRNRRALRGRDMMGRKKRRT